MVLVLAAAAVLPGLGIGLTAGMPQAIPVSPAPVVGDCLIDAPPALFNVNSSSQGMYAYSELRIGRCSGARYGEIVAVFAGAAPAADAGIDSCTLAASVYLGLPITAGKPSPLFTFWYPSISAEWFVLNPSERQAAAGQRWSACMVYLPSGDPRTVGERFGSTLHNALLTGAESGVVGVCPDDQSWNGSDAGGCGSPHSAEVFGTDYFIGGHQVSRLQMESTCASLVQLATGMADVTAAGRLTVEIQASSPDGYPVTGPEIPASAYVKCGLQAVGSRLLAGSLLAVGNKPIPWA